MGPHAPPPPPAGSAPDLAPIAPKSFYTKQEGNTWKTLYTNEQHIKNVIDTTILLIKEPSSKPIAQLNLKEDSNLKPHTS